MKKMKYVFAAVLFLPLTGYAQADRGNGGDAVICKQTDGQETVELLDRVEARKMGFEISVPGNTLREKVEGFTARYRNLQGFVSTAVTNYANDFLDGIENQPKGANVVWDDGVLFDIPDSQEVSIPANCQKQQLIIRETPGVKGDPEYTIQSTLWAKMDLDNQAMAIAHEALYKWFHYSSSRYARAMNRYLNSTRAVSADPVNFLQYSLENAARFSVNLKEFALPDRLDYFGSLFELKYVKITDEALVYQNPQNIFDSFDVHIVFMNQGKAKNLNVRLFAWWPDFKLIFDRKTSTVHFENVDLETGDEGKIEFNGQSMSLQGPVSCDTDSEGNITEIRGQMKRVILKDGTWYKKAKRVTLDKDGNITSVR